MAEGYQHQRDLQSDFPGRVAVLVALAQREALYEESDGCTDCKTAKSPRTIRGVKLSPMCGDHSRKRRTLVRSGAIELPTGEH